MTGEITLRGKVRLLVEFAKNISSKTCGHHRYHIVHRKEKNVQEINELYIKGLTFTTLAMLRGARHCSSQGESKKPKQFIKTNRLSLRCLNKKALHISRGFYVYNV